MAENYLLLHDDEKSRRTPMLNYQEYATDQWNAYPDNQDILSYIRWEKPLKPKGMLNKTFKTQGVPLIFGWMAAYDPEHADKPKLVKAPGEESDVWVTEIDPSFIKPFKRGLARF